MINIDALIAEIHDALNGREYAPEVLNNIMFGNQTDSPCVTKFKEDIWYESEYGRAKILD